MLIPSSAETETFGTTQFHFLAGAQTGSKGKMGIQQPLSSPILFHLQKTNFSSYLIYKIMSNLVMQQYYTQLSFPSIRAGTWQRKFLYSPLTSIWFRYPFFLTSPYSLKEYFHLGLIPHFTLKLVFSGWQYSFSAAKFSVEPLFRIRHLYLKYWLWKMT